MLRSFASILGFALLSTFCARGVTLEFPPDPNSLEEEPHDIPSPMNFEDDELEEKNNAVKIQEPKAEDFSVCKDFAKRNLRPIKISGAESVVKLRGDSGIHLQVMATGDKAVVRIVPSPLQKDLSRLCISLARNVSKLTLQVDAKLQDVIVKTPGSQAKVEIDTGDHGILEKVRSDVSGKRPQYYLKGMGVRPCNVPSDDYFCE